ncbi:hypothetical protein D3C72_1324120 [compost metagenome]
MKERASRRRSRSTRPSAGGAGAGGDGGGVAGRRWAAAPPLGWAPPLRRKAWLQPSHAIETGVEAGAPAGTGSTRYQWKPRSPQAIPRISSALVHAMRGAGGEAASSGRTSSSASSAQASASPAWMPRWLASAWTAARGGVPPWTRSPVAWMPSPSVAGASTAPSRLSIRSWPRPWRSRGWGRRAERTRRETAWSRPRPTRPRANRSPLAGSSSLARSSRAQPFMAPATSTTVPCSSIPSRSSRLAPAGAPSKRMAGGAWRCQTPGVRRIPPSILNPPASAMGERSAAASGGFSAARISWTPW